MSLVPDYENSSNSTSSAESESETDCISSIKDGQTMPLTKNKLPTPLFGDSITAIGEELKSSVFKNPFIDAENAKQAILQKHVKMIDTKDNIVVINGKKICWNYRKGRCRFGHNCKFAHDSDIQKTNEQIESDKRAAIENSVICQKSHGDQTRGSPMNALDERKSVEEIVSYDNQKRKRPGLTQGLIPGKKVMKQYLKNQNT